VPELGEDAGEKPGHLHLGDADLLCDLVLGESFEEAQPENEAITLAERAHGWIKHQPRLGGALVVVVAGEQLSERRRSAGTNREIK
jgi:hypothetical protein